MDADKREDISIQYQENAAPKKSHFKRFWWVYLIVLLCIVVIVVPVILIVGVKNIAQSKLNKATLEIQGITVTETQSNQFVMSINSTIASDSTKATIRAFNGSMYLEDEANHTPFATILFPETENQPMQSINVSQVVPIANLEALTVFNTWLLMNESLRVTVEGDTHIRVHGIARNYPAKFKKTITMPGINKFDGISVSDPAVNITNFPDGTNFHATVTIPNRSLVSFDIGNTTFTTYLKGSDVGTTYLDNVVLNSGNNTFPYRASIANLAVLGAVTSQPYCNNGTLPFELTGKSVTNFGQNLTYYSDALAAGNTTVTVALTEALAKVGVTVKCP